MSLVLPGMGAKTSDSLFAAVRSRDLSAVEAALAEGADINASESYRFAIDREVYEGSHTPLALAAALGETAIALRLLDVPGIKVDIGDKFAGQTALMHAAKQGIEPLVDRLLAMAADANAEDRYDRATPARYAIRNGHEAVALKLIAATRLDRFGPGLLCEAAWFDQRGLVEALLARGVSPDAKDETGRTARHMAAWGKRHWALDRFEKVNPRGPKLADLFAAAAAGDVRAIEAAIAFGVPVNARRADGANALLVAVEAGQRGAAKALLAQRGNPRLPDNQGRTALGIATARGDRAMIDLIQLWAPEP
jgi:ankyrin repeat protein